MKIQKSENLILQKIYIFILEISMQKVMKPFSIKAILISSLSVANIDIGFFVKNLTYTFLKSFCKKNDLLEMPSLKSSASVVLLPFVLTGHGCNLPEMKYSLSFSSVFSIFVFTTS
jgi:hypothetical protein